jgi:antitoxin PrlF
MPTATATVTSKGQITIPVEVREALKLKPGEKVKFFSGENGEFIVRRVGSIQDLRGCLAGLGLPKTDKEMNELIYKRAAELDAATKSDATVVSDGEAA